MRQAIVLFIILLLCTTANAENQARGKQVAFTFELGNCLACHVIAEGDSPGNIGPELKTLPSRFKDKLQLHAFIWDATLFNPNTSMPPFGKNKILTGDDIDAVVDYLWQLP
jgi:sulfur-oxidizing protein SoxX